MASTPRLSDTLVAVLRQQQPWLERRHLKPLAWMIGGLIQAGKSSLTAWAAYVPSRAVQAQRRVRRFARWLDKSRIAVQALSGPLVPHALAAWAHQVLSLALETSRLGKPDWLVRSALVSRGRAVPRGWTVLEHPSRRVAQDVSTGWLEQGEAWLPDPWSVVFTAQRGFADTHLMEHLTEWGGPWRIRITGRVGVSRRGTRPCNVHRLPLSSGQALGWHHSDLTKQACGPVQRALGRPLGRTEDGFVVSAERTESKTFAASGRRFDLAEHCVADQSNGFQLGSSLIRSAKALERLCGVVAITTRYLVAPGTAVVTQGKRRGVDSPWLRGPSYLNSGWNGVQLARRKGYELITRLHLSPHAAPVPAMASKRQHQQPPQRFFTLEAQDAVA